MDPDIFSILDRLIASRPLGQPLPSNATDQAALWADALDTYGSTGALPPASPNTEGDLDPNVPTSATDDSAVQRLGLWRALQDHPRSAFSGPSSIDAHGPTWFGNEVANSGQGLADHPNGPFAAPRLVMLGSPLRPQGLSDDEADQSEPPPPLPLDDGVYRPGAGGPHLLRIAGNAEEDEPRSETGEYQSPAQLYREYKFNLLSAELRKLEPNNPEGYRQFMGGPNDDDIYQLQTELNAARGRAWQRSQEPPPDFSGATPSRPSWQDSENRINEILGPRFRPQISFSNGEEVRHGTPGSSRPDSFAYGAPADAIEVKNYNIETAEGRNRLINRALDQARARAASLPHGARQTIFIDARGQSLSPKDADQLKMEMVLSSNGIISYQDIVIMDK